MLKGTKFKVLEEQYLNKFHSKAKGFNKMKPFFKFYVSFLWGDIYGQEQEKKTWGHAD